MSSNYQYNNPKLKKRRQKLRNEPPLAEQILWGHLKGSQLNGLKFRRQYGVGKFIVDFYCPALRLAVELDGDSHFEEGVEEYDKKRQEYIEQYDISFFRFTNEQVYEDLDGVLETIAKKMLGTSSG